MTKVEEATKAAYEDWISGVEDLELPWDKLPQDHKLRLMSSIRAAIEALRTPSIEMMRAYAEAVNAPVHGEYLDTPIAYRVMITAALGETDE